MRKAILILLILLSLLVTANIASARDRGHYYHRHSYYSGIRISPPAIWIAPPFYYRSYYPSYRVYPHDVYYEYGYRVWVPGYWKERWGPYGWEKVWVPGYWRYE